MEVNKQQVQRAKLLQTIAVISIFLLLGCGEKKGNQEFVTEHNLQILDTVIKQVCNRWKNDSLKKNYQLHLINYSDEDFSNILGWDVIANRRNHPEYKEIFTEDNIEFFKEQLKAYPEDYFTKLLPRNDCYEIKNEIQQEEQIPPPLYRPQDYYISKVIFTRDLKYALFIAGKGAFGLDIYTLNNEEYKPYKSIYLYIE